MASGMVEPPMPAMGIFARCSGVKSGWSSTLVTKKAAPPPSPMSSACMMRSTSPGSHTSRMWMRWSRRRGSSSALSMPMKCPTGAPVSVAGVSMPAIAPN